MEMMGERAASADSCARRAPTMKLWSLDARSWSQPKPPSVNVGR